MIVTDVLSPRLPPLRRRSKVVLALALLTLFAIPAYQAYNGAFSGSTSSANGAFGPNLQVTLERSEVAAGDAIQGTVSISAPDGAQLSNAVVTVYPSGVAMTPSNVVGTASLSVPASMSAGSVLRIPFSFDASALAVGTYSLNVELPAQVDKGSVHAALRTVATAGFTIR